MEARNAEKGDAALFPPLRLDNVLTERDPEKLAFTVFPEGPRGLRIERAEGMYWGNEPSWIGLEDGHLMPSEKGDAALFPPFFRRYASIAAKSVAT